MRTTYKSLVDLVFKEQKRVNVEVYVDDLLIKSKLPTQHMEDPKEMFILKRYNMQLNLLKFISGAGSGKFIGVLHHPRRH